MAQGVTVNLSNFALFLSVMQDKRAYRNTLSIIMDEPDIQIREVKVEWVVLNKSGKRAIRLDAWALSEDERQFNMEMENRAEKDSVPKRARYYQGLLDSPILKSGRKTKYKNLPQTVIIFITQEDIFGRDRAKYTFTEQCEEVADLKLEDGTTKIFLNITSKNGSPELISLLQYMKTTNLDNPEILVKDKRILELDEIVTEVKESEEWEDMEMDILDYGLELGLLEGIEKGRELGMEQGIAQGIEEGLAKGMEEGLAKGMKQGLEQGELFVQIGLIIKNLQKGLSVSTIAEFMDVSDQMVHDIEKLNSQGLNIEEICKHI